MIERYFTEHPRSVGESYGEHFQVAGSFGIAMIVAGVACLVHALIPGLFIKTGSSAIARLHQRMIVNRSRAVSADERHGIQAGQGIVGDRQQP